MRRWAGAIPLLAAATVAFSLTANLTACRPRDERPGLWLRGESATSQPNDWHFAHDVEEIFIETRPWYGIPQSNTIWCAEIGGTLYVGSYGDHKKAWEKNIARNPEARLEIEGKTYEVRLQPVTDPDLVHALDTAYAEKYDMADVFGDDLPKWWYYRVMPRAKEAPHRTSSNRSR